MWNKTFSAVTANIYLRLLFPSTIAIGAVNSRSICTSQHNEHIFAILSILSEACNGTPPSIFIDRMVSRLVQQFTCLIQASDSWTLRLSAKYKAIYDFSYNLRESANILKIRYEYLQPSQPGQSARVNVRLVVKDHAFDNSLLRNKRDFFDCAKVTKNDTLATRTCGPRKYNLTQGSIQTLQNCPSLSLAMIENDMVL